MASGHVWEQNPNLRAKASFHEGVRQKEWPKAASFMEVGFRPEFAVLLPGVICWKKHFVKPPLCMCLAAALIATNGRGAWDRHFFVNAALSSDGAVMVQ